MENSSWLTKNGKVRTVLEEFIGPIYVLLNLKPVISRQRGFVEGPDRNPQ